MEEIKGIRSYGSNTIVFIDKFRNTISPKHHFSYSEKDLDRVVVFSMAILGGVTIDLEDLIKWVKENHPEMLISNKGENGEKA